MSAIARYLVKYFLGIISVVLAAFFVLWLFIVLWKRRLERCNDCLLLGWQKRHFLIRYLFN